MSRMLLFILLLMPLQGLVAQEASQLRPGDQVRVWRVWPFDYWAEGSVVALEGDTLVVKEKIYQTTLVLPLESLEKLEVRRGQGMMGKHWELVLQRKISSITPGTPVRIRRSLLPDGPNRWLVGTAIAMDADSLVMRAKGSAERVAVARATMGELNVSRGKSRDKGAILGAAIGFVGGIIYHKVINPPEYQCLTEKKGGLRSDCTNEGDTVFSLFADGSTGVPFGALIGLLLFAEERWESVPLALDMGFSPQEGGKVALRVDFRR